jgi:hypothetical protein
MNSPRIALTLLLAIVSTSPLAGNSMTQILAAHPVWISEDLKWEQDPGDKEQSWAAGGALYFGEHGEFGRFGGVLVKRGTRLGFSGGEGEIIYAGTWNVKAEIAQIDYRLVGMYKVVRPTGDKAPEIPGPVQHAQIRLDSKSLRHLEFDGERYEATSHLKASELKARLQVYASADGSNHTVN